MNTWYNGYGMNIASVLAEDTGAPELRNPRHSAARGTSWLVRLFAGRR